MIHNCPNCGTTNYPTKSKIVRNKGGGDSIRFKEILEYDVKHKKNIDTLGQNKTYLETRCKSNHITRTKLKQIDSSRCSSCECFVGRTQNSEINIMDDSIEVIFQCESCNSKEIKAVFKEKEGFLRNLLG